jgi:shikimate dehydrogenase
VPFERDALNAAASEATLVVNASSLGMGSDDVPAVLPLAGIGPGQVVNDLVYRPGGTPWLAAAGARGARTVDGLGMLLHQGAAAFERWTGEPAPVDVMRSALLSPGD